MKNIISIFLLLTSLSFSVFSQTIVNGKFEEVLNNGTNYVVKVQISTNTGTEILQDANIPFTFNTTNLAYVSTLFNNFFGGDYNTLNTVTISANRISLNIVLSNTSGGTVVSSIFMDVATITFSTINSAGSSNLTFVPLLEFFTPPNLKWDLGTFTDLNTDPLPVELSSFTASTSQSIVNLKWQTATEVNNYGFDVERKTSDTQWKKVGFVNGNGNSNSPKTYSFKDGNLIGGSKFQYRLKQIDNDGQFEYTEEIEVDVVPNQYELAQNYPNPFNPNTKIRFQIPERIGVVIQVFNAIGEKVAELLNDVKEAGYYEINFDAKGLAGGVYFYNISAGKYNMTKKMILLK